MEEYLKSRQYSDKHVIDMCGITRQLMVDVYNRFSGPHTPLCHPCVLLISHSLIVLFFSCLMLFPYTPMFSTCRRHLYNLLVFYKCYSVQSVMHLQFDRGGSSSKAAIMRVRRTEHYLANRMNGVAIAWGMRHQHRNHLPHYFHKKVTASLDTFPVYVNRPRDGWLQKKLYNGKYGIPMHSFCLCYHCLLCLDNERK
jgi:hypothetical protein